MLETRSQDDEGLQVNHPLAAYRRLQHHMQNVCNAGVLQAMQKHLKAPPQAVLDAWRPDALLDARDCDEAYLLQGPRPGAAHKLLTPPPQLQQAVRF